MTIITPVGVGTTPNDGTGATLRSLAQTVNLIIAELGGVGSANPVVQYATAAALATNTYLAGVLTASANGALSIDGSSPSVNDRVLVKNEAAPAKNGVYVVTTVGSGGAPYVLTRADDYNTWDELAGTVVFVQKGTANAETAWQSTADAGGTIGSTSVPYVQVSSGTISSTKWGYLAAATAFGGPLIAAADLAGLVTAGGGASAWRTQLGLAIGTNVQAYDANTAKTNAAAQEWSASQEFGMGARNYFGSNSSVYSIGFGYSAARVNSTQVAYIGATDSATPDLIFSNASGSEIARMANSGAFSTFGAITVGGQLDITGGNLSSVNGLHAYFLSNAGYLRSLQNGVAWRDLSIDAATLYLNASSLGPVITNGSYFLHDYGANGTSVLYVGGANNQATAIAIRSNSARSRGVGFYTGLSSLRWLIECESTAESGANAGSNFAISNWSDAGAYINTPLYIGRASGNVSLLGVAMGGPINLKSYTVAGLPAGSAGDTVYASNGRKNGEGAGAGTGVIVFKDGTAWRACDTGATVAA